MTADPAKEAYLAESQEGLLYAMFIIPIPLEILSTLFRLWVKARKTASRRIASDDYLMIFAVVMSIMVCVIGVSFGPSNKLGRHMDIVSDEELAAFRRGDYIFSHFYNFAIATTKLAVLALYHRIFETPLFRKLIIGTSAFIVAWILVMEVVMFAGCRPLHGWWAADEEDTCINKIAFTFFTNITNIATDVWIFSMPIPTILRLQALRDRRVSLCFLFSVGLGTCLISAARLGFIFAVGETGDVTWWGGPLGILSCWEPCGGVLCANLPIVYKSFVRLLRQVSSSIGGGSVTPTRGVHSKAQSQSGIYSEGFHRDWQRLNDSGNININGSKPAVSATASSNGMIGSERDDLELTEIVVQRGFTTEQRRRSPMGRGSDTDVSTNIR